MAKLLSSLGGRKFAVTMLIIILLIADNKLNLGLGLDKESISNAIILLALSYIGVEGAADVVSRAKNPQPKK